MQIVREANKKISDIWGKNQIKACQYRLLKYTMSTYVPDGMLLYNVVTGQMVLLSQAEETFVKSLPRTVPEEHQDFIRQHFLVPVDYDEKAIVNKIRKVIRLMNANKRINGYVILPTTCCNAKCYYCYESQYHKMNMTTDTINSLIHFMKSNAENNPLHIQWFGGEPLLKADHIDYICSELRTNGVDFVSTMTSNGFLFSNAMVEKAVEVWNLRRVQITLDGTEKVYNSIKRYISFSESPYYKVLSNIKLLLNAGIHVVIRLNLGMDNYEDLKALVFELATTFKENKYLDVYVRPLYDGKGYSPVCYTSTSKDELSEKSSELTALLREVGLIRITHGLPEFRAYSCMADKESQVVVYPDGRLFKCEHIIQEDAIGDIRSREFDKKVLGAYQETFEFEWCGDCKIYPSCVLLKKCDGISEKSVHSCRQEIANCIDGMVYHYYKQQGGEDVAF